MQVYLRRIRLLLILIILVIATSSCCIYAKSSSDDAQMELSIQPLGISVARSGPNAESMQAAFGKKNTSADTPPDIQKIIDDAVLLAVRQEEQYVLLAVRNSLSDYREQIQQCKKSRDLWVKVSIAQSCVIAIAAVTGGIYLINKNNRYN